MEPPMEAASPPSDVEAPEAPEAPDAPEAPGATEGAAEEQQQQEPITPQPPPPEVVASTVFGTEPQKATCGSCGKTGKTKTKIKKQTLGNTLICLLVPCGVWVCCCPCNCLSKVEHYCNECNKLMGTS